jgi:hypothetical protein
LGSAVDSRHEGNPLTDGLSARTIAAITDSGSHTERLRILFWVTLMQSAWALGEAIGALFGAGKSMNEWR